MKLTLLALCTVLLTSGLLASAAPAPKEIAIGISDAYVPTGFDSTSDAFVVTNGVFPNSCYRYSRSEVLNIDETTHVVKIYALVQPGMCLMVLVPFTKEVHLGKLKQGVHVIQFQNGDGTYFEKSLKIE